MKCPKCNYDNPNGVSVCINCKETLFEREKSEPNEKKKSRNNVGYITFISALLCVMCVYIKPDIMFWIGDGIYLLLVLFLAIPQLKENYQDNFDNRLGDFISFRFKNILNKSEIGNTLNFIVCIFLPIVPIIGYVAYSNYIENLFL